MLVTCHRIYSYQKTVEVAIDRTTMRGIKFRAIEVEFWIEKEGPICIAGLDKPIEPYAARVGVPNVAPVTGLFNEMIIIGGSTEPLGNKCDTEVVIGVFKQT